MKTQRLTLAMASILAAGAGAFSAGSHAAVATTTLAVSATITAACSITTTPLAFGNYDPITGAAVNGTGSVTTVCTLGTAPVITLDEGANPAVGSVPGVPIRQMASGIDRLGYFLYSDAGHGTLWGGTPATGVSDPATGNAHTPLTIYGVITANQNKPAGNYTDTVTATVTF